MSSEQAAKHSSIGAEPKQSTAQEKNAMASFRDDKPKNSPNNGMAKQLSQIPNQASQRQYDMHKSLSIFGKQAMSVADKNMVLHIKNQGFSGTTEAKESGYASQIKINNDLQQQSDAHKNIKHGGNHNSITYEDSKDIFYAQ